MLFPWYAATMLARPSDLPILMGDASKLRAAVAWEPQFTLARSLRDIYDDARARVATVGA